METEMGMELLSPVCEIIISVCSQTAIMPRLVYSLQQKLFHSELASSDDIPGMDVIVIVVM